MSRPVAPHPVRLGTALAGVAGAVVLSGCAASSGADAGADAGPAGTAREP